MSADLDKAIDRVAREMLDVEPPADLRERVLDRIETPRRGFAWTWIAVSAAAAAILVVALLLSRQTDVVRPRSGTDYRLTADLGEHPNPAPTVSQTSPPVAAPKRIVRATVVDDVARPDEEHVVAPLAGPPPIALPTIARGAATPLTTIDVAPIDVQPLQVTALPETPRERPQE